VVTVFHEFLKTYRIASYIGKGASNPETPQDIQSENVGGTFHMKLYQEAEGHGMLGCTSGVNCGQVVEDGVRYIPDAVMAQTPVLPVGSWTPVKYTLIDMSDLLARRHDWPTFSSADDFNGDGSGTCGEGFSTCKDNGADGLWHHGPDSQLGQDPAAFFSSWFTFASQPLPSGSYVGNAFLHQKCETGARMQGDSDSCVAQVCAVDPFCCASGWDGQCVQEVNSICHKTCTSCTASICSVQTGPIGTGCGSFCALWICSLDPYCCQTKWDSLCVSEVGSICGLGC
jgi:hypothetical protein